MDDIDLRRLDPPRDVKNPQGQIEWEEEGVRGHVREGDKRKIEGRI